MFVCASDVRLGGRMVVPPWLVNPNRKSRPPISGAKSEGSPRPTRKKDEGCVKKGKVGVKIILTWLFCDFIPVTFEARLRIKHIKVNQTGVSACVSIFNSVRALSESALQVLGGLTGLRGSEQSGSLQLSLHLSNYSDRLGSALTHSLWGHEINTCSPTINKCLFKWQRLLALTPSSSSPLPSAVSSSFHNAFTFTLAGGSPAGSHFMQDVLYEADHRTSDNIFSRRKQRQNLSCQIVWTDRDRNLSFFCSHLSPVFLKHE